MEAEGECCLSCEVCPRYPTSSIHFKKSQLILFARNFTEAFANYTEAIALNPLSQTLYSNRSAALLSLGRLPLALNDAKRCVELDQKWAKGYRRKASVLDAMKRFRESLVVYEEALEVTRSDASLSEETKKKEEAEVMKLMIGWYSTSSSSLY
jgi:tetratricopeptide (TPR) repeat protein